MVGLADGSRAETPAAQSSGDLADLRSALDEQTRRLLDQQRQLAEQMRVVEQHQRELDKLRQQLAGDAQGAAEQVQAGVEEPFGAAPRVPEEEAARLRGGQGSGASTLQTLPPQRFFGRVRGQVIPVAPESLEEVGPFQGEPPIPVFVPEEKRKEFLRLRKQMQELVVPPEEKPATPPAAETAVTARKPTPTAPQAAAPPAAPTVVAPGRVPQEAAPPPQQPTNVAAIEEQRPEIVGEALANVGGVLTPAGMLVVEPSLEYVNNAANRFNFAGVEVVGVLFGSIQANQTERNIVTAATTLRYGITDRIEVDAKFPFVYRNDQDRSQVVGDTTPTSGSIENYGLGDIEFGAHYQITGKAPYLIANLRAKSDTGDGPFDVNRNAQGVETESPTGSGFWSLEPSVSMIYPVEPAVLFANVGYLHNFERDVNTQVGDVEFGKVDPGDAVKGSLGLGFALNERTSVSLGYEHNYVFATDSDVTDADGNQQHDKSDTLQVGSFFVGGSYSISDNVSVNSTLQLGATDDAPDVQFTVRVPVRFDVMGALKKMGVGGDGS